MLKLFRSISISKGLRSIKLHDLWSSFLGRGGKGSNLSNETTNLKTPYYTNRSISINTYETPNPNSIKFQVGQNILNVDTFPQNFSSEESSNTCDLARILYQIPGIKGIYIGQDFITVSKVEESAWEDLKSKIDVVLNEFFTSNKFVHISSGSEEPNENKNANEASKDVIGNNDSDIVAMIKEVIESKIRPTIQEDGGDLVFVGFEKGLVKVKLQGSCTDCPSSEVTLKMGVQNMLKFYVPEVLEVIQVRDQKDNLSDKEFEKFDSTIKEA